MTREVLRMLGAIYGYALVVFLFAGAMLGAGFLIWTATAALWVAEGRGWGFALMFAIPAVLLLVVLLLRGFELLVKMFQRLCEM